MPLLHCTTAYTTALSIYLSQSSRAGSGVVRIDPLRFLAGCRKRRLNQALSVLPLSLGFFRCMCCARDQGLFLGCVIFYIICVRYVSSTLLVVLVTLSVTVPVQVIDWKDSSPRWPIYGDVKPYSLTRSLTHYLCQWRTIFFKKGATWPFMRIAD